MHNKFTQKARNTLKSAQSEAGALGHAYIGSEHLLLGLAAEKDSIAARVLGARGINATLIRSRILSISGEGEKYRQGPTDMTGHAKRIVELAADVAAKKGCSYVGTEHLLAALLGERDCVGVKIIEGFGVSPVILQSDLDAHQSAMSPINRENTPSVNGESKVKSAKASALLSAYTHDMTEAAKEGRLDPTIGREKETERIIRILSRRQKNNPCLIGEAGVGKTAVVEGLAKRIADGNVPPALEGKRILCLDFASMIAGAKYRGEFEERLKNVMAEAQMDSTILLFIDELHIIMGAGAAEGAVDAANILKPALARGNIRLIGATTTEEYKRHIERDGALERRFQAVFVEEPDEETAVKILTGLRQKYEAHHRLKIGDDAILAAVKLSSRYINDRYLPDKALDLIDEAAAKMSIASFAVFPDLPLLERQLASVKKQKEEYIFSQDFTAAAALRDKESELKSQLDALRREMRKKKHADLFYLGAEQIAEIVTQQTGVPIRRLLDGEGAALVGLEEKLSARVIGQPEAISTVCRAIRRGRVGLGDPSRPVGSFIFLGKTGVGKTELAVAVAEELLGSRNSLIRFDMSEFMEKHSVSRLIGSPPGYVGYGEGGQLTEKVRRRPYCVLLFDEIEKAHREVFNLLLQILEDGKLTDAQGRVVNFCNTIIIMTSNAGASDNKKITGFLSDETSDAAYKESMMSALKNTFNPEFLGRVDEIVLFNDLNNQSLQAIASDMLNSLSQRADSLGIKLNFDNSVSALLAKKCSATPHGARPLRKMVTSLAEDPITEKLLMGEIKSGVPVTVSTDGENVVVLGERKN